MTATLKVDNGGYGWGGWGGWAEGVYENHGKDQTLSPTIALAYSLVPL